MTYLSRHVCTDGSCFALHAFVVHEVCAFLVFYYCSNVFRNVLPGLCCYVIVFCEVVFIPLHGAHDVVLIGHIVRYFVFSGCRVLDLANRVLFVHISQFSAHSVEVQGIFVCSCSGDLSMVIF